MQSSLALLLAGACAAPPVRIPGWRYAAGSLAHGNDVVVVNTTLSKAMAMCAASSPASICCGVTFKGRDPAPGATVIVEAHLKSSCQLYPTWDRDLAWNTWFNLAQPGPATFTNAGTAGGTPHSFDCASRTYAYEYGKRLAPSRGAFRTLFDALQLQACNHTIPEGPPDSWRPPDLAVPSTVPASSIFIVVPTKEDNDNVAPEGGDEGVAKFATEVSATFSTISAAVKAARQAVAPRYILLREGVHYLQATLALNEEDSLTTIQNYNGERATISGGVLLKPEWKPAQNARVPNVFVSALPHSIKQLTGLRVAIARPAAGTERNNDGGGAEVHGASRRAVRARYPNANPLDAMREEALGGWISEATTWTPPVPAASPPTDYRITAEDWPHIEWPSHGPKGAPAAYNSSQTGEGDWGAFTFGVGGTCAEVDPPVGYWCQSKPPRGITPHQHPSGLTADPLLLPHTPYHNPTGAIVHAWRPSHWYTNQYLVGNASNATTGQWTIMGNTDTCWRGASLKKDSPDGVYKYLGNVSTLGACTAAATATAAASTAAGAGAGAGAATAASRCEGGLPFVAFSYFHLNFATDADFRGSCYGVCDARGWVPTPMVGVDSGRAPGSAQQFTFTAGGDQGGEGEGGGAEWYVENVWEELDHPNEFFHNESQHLLYYVVNSSSSSSSNAGNISAHNDSSGRRGDTSDGGNSAGSQRALSDNVGGLSGLRFTATSLAVLFNITGSKERPVKGFRIRGVELRDTRDTFMDPHGLPSGGDWALQKSAAITATGTEALAVDQCLLTKLDGNAIFLGGYHRNSTIVNNEFVEIGDSCIALWGETSTALNANGTLQVPWPIGPDAREGLQPWYTTISHNIGHEIGLFQKQSSLVFQAVAALTMIQHNIFFNGPRAAVNLNDGHGGGDDMSHNLFVNTCRESGDHGPFNSWDRMPYITALSGKASVVPLERSIHHNFLVGNYNALFAVDTDDGSSYYEIHHNFLVSAGEGLKSICGAHDMHHHDNIYAYPWGDCWFVSGGAPGTPGWSGGSGYNDRFVNNTCIPISNTGTVGYTGDCGELAIGFKVAGTTVMTQNGTLSICGTSLAKYQALHPGREVGTTVSAWPADDALIASARALLENF